MDFQGGEGGGGYDPRAILPTETWSQILGNLEDHPDPRDLTDASESCTLFSDILCDKVNPSRLAEVIPLVLQWLGHRDRLNCRCISKQVTRSVDSILGNVNRVEPNQHLNLYKSRFMPPRIPPSFEADHFGSVVNSLAVYWDNQVQVERFHREMATGDLAGRCHHHPMAWSSLHLRPYMERRDDPPRDLNDWKNCLERSLQLLPDYKNAIRHLTLDTRRPDLTGNLIETYDIRRRILTALPNLYCFFHVHWEDGAARVAEDVANLERHIAQNPLPAMRHLEDISLLNSWNPVPMPLVQEICARYGSQLKRLGTTQPADPQQSGDAQALFTLPALTHLRIANCAHVDRERNPPIILLNVQAENLVDLNLGTIHMSATGVLLPELVQYLRRFPRLASLYLNMTCMLLHGLQSRMISAGVTCPTVKKLKIATQRNQLPLTFFTELFPNLESFHFREEIGIGLLAGEFQEDFRLLLNQCGFECGVWGACPSLKEFRFYSWIASMNSAYRREAYQNGAMLLIQFEMQFEDEDEEDDGEEDEEEDGGNEDEDGEDN